MTKPSAAIARQDETPSVGAMIQSLRPELQRALPRGMDADRLARIALTVVRLNPELAKCNPYSFAGSLLTSAQLGLEPGVGGEAYLVPYKGECTLIIGYQGFAKLFWQHPLAKHLDSQAVHEGDDFDYGYGLEPFLRHKPAMDDRGEIVAYYACATLTTGGAHFVVLSVDEVKALRGGKTGPSGRIPDPQHWMERKTVLRQLVKMLPKSATLTQALDVDEKPGTELRAAQEPSRALDAPAGVDTTTGEVGPAYEPPSDDGPVDAELVDPDEPVWPEVAAPGTAGARA
jgi:recombination protein RecT